MKKPKIIDNKEFWKCCTCGKYYPAEFFYKDKRSKNGLKSQCKKCHLKMATETADRINKNKINCKSMRNARIKDPEKFRSREREYQKKRPKDFKYKARIILNRAVKKGLIARPKICENCKQEKKITAHHDDYTKPLDVKWLCYKCHGNK